MRLRFSVGGEGGWLPVLLSLVGSLWLLLAVLFLCLCRRLHRAELPPLRLLVVVVVEEVVEVVFVLFASKPVPLLGVVFAVEAAVEIRCKEEGWEDCCWKNEKKEKRGLMIRR